MRKIRKAVIPAAGFGTRFLPATKAMPKEMLPIVDKPAIQYIVEEILASGFRKSSLFPAMPSGRSRTILILLLNWNSTWWNLERRKSWKKSGRFPTSRCTTCASLI